MIWNSLFGGSRRKGPLWHTWLNNSFSFWKMHLHRVMRMDTLDTQPTRAARLILAILEIVGVTARLHLHSNLLSSKGKYKLFFPSTVWQVTDCLYSNNASLPWQPCKWPAFICLKMQCILAVVEISKWKDREEEGGAEMSCLLGLLTKLNG